MKNIATLISLIVLLFSAILTSAQTNTQKRKFIISFNQKSSTKECYAALKDLGLKAEIYIDELHLSVVEPAAQFTSQSIDEVRQNPHVANIEEDVYRNWLVDNAPEQEKAFSLNSTLYNISDRSREQGIDGIIPWGVARVNAPTAWKKGQGAKRKVAVIDTGIDCNHPDLKCDFNDGINILDSKIPAKDDNEHGTHVAGTIAGHGVSGDVYGVAPKAILIPVKVLNGTGSGYLSDIIKGINWATKHKVDVMNLSLGGGDKSEALTRAVNAALSAGITVVCAAGNSGPWPDTVGYPAAIPGVIAVAASTSEDTVADFSSRGEAISFIAPGVAIDSTVPGGGRKRLSGTSMAAPHVTGLVALAIERGARGPNKVFLALKKAATELPALAPTDQGNGLINAAALP